MSYINISEIAKNSEKGNDKCVDCENTKVAWASINHGIVLCLDCALNHKSTLSNKISYIKSLEMPNWTNDEVSLMLIGGNNNFHDFLKHYEIDPLNKDLLLKYNSKCTEFYRKFLLSEVKSSDLLIKKPSIEEGRQQLTDEDFKVLSGEHIISDKEKISYPNIDDINVNQGSSDENSHNYNDINQSQEGNNSTQHKQEYFVPPTKEEAMSDAKLIFNEGINLMKDIGTGIDDGLEKLGVKKALADGGNKAKNYWNEKAPVWKEKVATKSSLAYNSVKTFFGGKKEPQSNTNVNIGDINDKK